MLRSRGTRQRPSEPTDERSGSGYNYGGYPSSNHMGTSSTAVGGGSDEYGYSSQQYGQTPHGGYSGGSSGLHYVKSPRGASNPFKQKSSSSSSICGGMVWYCFLTIIFIGLSIDTFAQLRSYTKSLNQLKLVSSHLDQIIDDPAIEEIDTEITNEEFESDPQAELRLLQTKLHTLSESQSHLQSSLAHYNSKSIPSIKSQLESVKHRIESVQKEQEVRDLELNSLREGYIATTKEIEELKVKFGNEHKTPEGNFILGNDSNGKKIEIGDHVQTVEELELYVQEREEVLWRKIDALVGRLKGQSRLEVVEWFGKGPHRVEFEIEYPQHVEDVDISQWPRVRGVFLIELAPLDIMPVAVHMFLQQVHHKLWNGCEFVINAMHILQAGPHKRVGSQYIPNEPELLGRFTAAKLDKMPFQEYDARYPHEIYTLGMSGRPGGPDFYINKVNNTVNHGPGGQKIHDLHEEADPCFGKLIGGIELLGEIGKIPIDYVSGNTLQQQVVIVDARIVTEAHNPYQEPNHVHLDDDYHKDHLADGNVEQVEEHHDEPMVEQHHEEPQPMAETERQHVQAGPGPTPV